MAVGSLRDNLSWQLGFHVQHLLSNFEIRKPARACRRLLSIPPNGLRSPQSLVKDIVAPFQEKRAMVVGDKQERSLI